MSKRTSEAAAPSITPTVTDSPTPLSGVSRQQLAAQKIDTEAAEVIQWGNGEPTSMSVVDKATGQVIDGDDKTPAETPSGKAKKATSDDSSSSRSSSEPSAETETAEAASTETAKPKVSAERRAEILRNLDAERKRVDIESQVTTERARAAAAEAKLQEFEKSPLGRKLRTIAKQHNLSYEDLKDKMMIGADDVNDDEPATATKPTTAEDPRIAVLLKDKEEREQREADERHRQVIGHVRESLKDEDLPLVDTFNAYGRVMTMAHQAWKAGGSEGAVVDYLQDAAGIVEDELKKEQPRAAARLYPKAVEAEEEEVAAPTPKPQPKASMGRRTAARPGSKPSPLPDDPFERDQAIKKRMGWI